MKYPDRPPRNEPNPEKYNYYDHETAVQDDGKIAMFGWEYNKRDKGWVFSHYVDKYGFWIWEEEDHFKRWNDEITYEQLLLLSKIDNPHYDIKTEFGPDFKIADDEEIYSYVYGGPLSQRGGWFVVKKGHPCYIIRSKLTWLS